MIDSDARRNFFVSVPAIEPHGRPSRTVYLKHPHLLKRAFPSFSLRGNILANTSNILHHMLLATTPFQALIASLFLFFCLTLPFNLTLLSNLALSLSLLSLSPSLLSSLPSSLSLARHLSRQISKRRVPTRNHVAPAYALCTWTR